MGGGVNLVAHDAAANVEQRRVSAGYFAVLGVSPFIGREFTADEDRKGGPPVAILSYGLWTRVFGSDRAIVGQPIRLRGEPYTVVGVMPHGFTTGVPTDVWTPIQPARTGEGGGSNYGMIARVRPNVTWDQANAEINQLGAPAMMLDYEKADYKDQVSVQCSLVPLQQRATADIRQPLLMLWGAVGLVLLIACVNIAGLLLARSGSRTREIATRMALGSGRRAVIRQLLVESAVLAVAGGALGPDRRLGRAPRAHPPQRRRVPARLSRAARRHRAGDHAARRARDQRGLRPGAGAPRQPGRRAGGARPGGHARRGRRPRPAGAQPPRRRRSRDGRGAARRRRAAGADLRALAQLEPGLRSVQRDHRDDLAAGQAV